MLKLLPKLCIMNNELVALEYFNLCNNHFTTKHWNRLLLFNQLIIIICSSEN